MRSLSLLFLSQLVLGGVLLEPESKRDDPLAEGKYIAVLKNGIGAQSVNDIGMSIQNKVGGKQVTGQAFSIGSFTAIPVSASKAQAQSIAAMDQIAYMEVNYRVTTAAPTPKKKTKEKAKGNAGVKTQNDPDWGLARLSSAAPRATQYRYDARGGNNTFAYIVDTGIWTSHPDFGGRAKFGFSSIANETDDGNGHGTHVAGIVASRTYGVSKLTNLIAVKVLDDTGSGFASTVIEGLQWVVNDAKTNKRLKKSVINMSLAGPKSQALSDAAKAAADAGIFVAVAAGNSNDNASKYSPANSASVCTVAATDINDARAGYSNYGKSVDIFAPGTNIESTWPPNSSAVLSGTSMASPHVAGLGAYILSIKKIKNSDLCKYLQQISNKNRVTDPRGTVNDLAFNGMAPKKS